MYRSGPVVRRHTAPRPKGQFTPDHIRAWFIPTAVYQLRRGYVGSTTYPEERRRQHHVKKLRWVLWCKNRTEAERLEHALGAENCTTAITEASARNKARSLGIQVSSIRSF
jgi:hypothetical protein